MGGTRVVREQPLLARNARSLALAGERGGGAGDAGVDSRDGEGSAGARAARDGGGRHERRDERRGRGDHQRARDISRCPTSCPGPTGSPSRLKASRSSRRPASSLTVNNRVEMPVTLDVGALVDEVTVAAEAPLLDTTSASASTSLSNRQVNSLPVFGNSAMLLARSVPGVQWTGQPNYLGLHSNAGASGTNAAGGVGGNEYSLDGVSNSADGRRVAYLPYTDTVAEIKVETASFDASKGHSSGANVSALTKSGTNAFRGSATWQYWNSAWNATQSTTNAAYYGAIEKAIADGNSAEADRLRGQPKSAAGHSNNWATVIGGPVTLPRLFSGRDKLFFFFSYNGFKDVKSEEVTAVNRTVPTEAQRRGDFSDLLRIDPVRYQIYDPRTARLENGRVVRDPFPNNQVPILNPIYQAVPAAHSAAEQSRRHRLSRRPEQLSRVRDAVQLGLQGVQHARRLEPFEPASHVRALELERLPRRSRRLDLRNRARPDDQRPGAAEPRRHRRSRVRAERHDDLERLGRLQPLHRRQPPQRRADVVLAGRRWISRLHGRPRPRDRRRHAPAAHRLQRQLVFRLRRRSRRVHRLQRDHRARRAGQDPVDAQREDRRRHPAAPPREHRGRQHVGRDDAPQRLRPPARQHQQRGIARPRMGGVHARRDRHHDGQQHEPCASPTRITRRTCRTTGACPTASR